jgi:hypothetical protein
MDERWTTAKLLLDASWTQILIMKNCVQTWNMVISPSNSWILLDSNTKHQTYNFNPSKIKDFIIIKYPRGNFTPPSDFRRIPWIQMELQPVWLPRCPLAFCYTAMVWRPIFRWFT